MANLTGCFSYGRARLDEGSVETRNEMVWNGNLRVTVDGSRPYNHITILVNTPPTEREPGATDQLCIVRVGNRRRKRTPTSGLSLELVYPPVEGK